MQRLNIQLTETQLDTRSVTLQITKQCDCQLHFSPSTSPGQDLEQSVYCANTIINFKPIQEGVLRALEWPNMHKKNHPDGLSGLTSWPKVLRA